MAAPNMPGWRWANEKLARYFPTLTTLRGPVATGVGTQQGPYLVALINAISAANTTSANNTLATTIASTKIQEKQNESKQMSRGELLTLIQMCGKASTGNLAGLPAWLQECSAEGTTEPYIMMILQRYITTNNFIEDADVPMISQLLKMIMKRSWTGKDGNINCPPLVHTMYGLSPFTMLDLNEDEMELLNDEKYLLNAYSLVSAEDLRLQRRKLNICISLEGDDFMLMLKRYVNLLYAVFQTHAHSLRRLVR